MLLLFRYFWFIAAAFMAVNIVLWRRRLAVAVERGVATEDEAARFVRALLVWLVGGSLLLGIVSMAAGWTSPLCAAKLGLGTVPTAISSFVMAGTSLAMLWWVWHGDNADLLGRIVPVMGRSPDYGKRYSPRSVRLVVTALVVVSTLMNVDVGGSLPSSPLTACPNESTLK